eukprot:SAG31_NODE_15597_length_747_cov_1.320988_1_plen_167_part_10
MIMKMMPLCSALLALQLSAAASAVGADAGCDHEITGGDLCPAVSVLRRVAAAEICGGDTVAASLRRVGLAPHTADTIGVQMEALELHTAQDLRLLASTPEAEHLFASLTDSRVSIGARSKVRLLVASNTPERPQTGVTRPPATGGERQRPRQHQMGVSGSGALRRLQ